MKHVLLTLTAFLASAALGLADDYYVDPTSGDDANDGLTPLTAWRTLAFAVDQVNGPIPHTIHALAGVHIVNEALLMTDSIAVIGDAGSAATAVRFEATGGSGSSFFFVPSDGPAAGTNLKGLSIERGYPSVIAYSWFDELLELELEDVRMANTHEGLQAIYGQGHARIRLRRCVIEGQGRGINVARSIDLVVDDCVIRDSFFGGLLALELVGVQGETARITLRRTTITGSLNYALALSGSEAVLVSIEDSVVESTLRNAIIVADHLGELRVTRSTIAGNGGIGLWGGPGVTRLLHSVVASNTPDTYGTIDAQHSIVQDGSVTGVGVLALDPRFEDPANGDHRLRHDSPALDQFPAGGHDVSGRARDVDGDLDLVARGDLGAYEFRALEQVGLATAGGQLELELRAASTSPSIIVLAPAALATQPLATPYGQLALDPTVAWRALTVTPSGQPTLLSLPIPIAASGQTWSVQPWIVSSSAPAGAAFGNALEFRVEAP
jgi:hypothetical protein